MGDTWLMQCSTSQHAMKHTKHCSARFGLVAILYLSAAGPRIWERLTKQTFLWYGCR